MSQYRLSRAANSDLRTIAAYLGDRRPSAAVTELEKLIEKFSLLGKSPLLGELRRDLPGTLRGFSAGKYVILYRPIANGIEVARVVHAARDLGSLLGHEPS